MTMANISYTSGTTAEPKGIMLTHGNYVSNVLQADSLIQIPPYYKVLLFLPWLWWWFNLLFFLPSFAVLRGDFRR